jgi:hypothetical protein
LKVLRPEVSVYNVYITSHYQFQTTFAEGEEGVKYVVEEGTVNNNEES